MGVGNVLVFTVFLSVGVGSLVGGVVHLAQGDFRMAFLQLVFGTGVCLTLGYQGWYGRNVIRKREDNRAN